MCHLLARKEKISLTAFSFSPQAQGWEGGLVPDSLRPSPAPSRLVGWLVNQLVDSLGIEMDWFG